MWEKNTIAFFLSHLRRVLNAWTCAANYTCDDNLLQSLVINYYLRYYYQHRSICHKGNFRDFIR